MKEIWKPIVGFEQSHEINNLGNIRSKERIIIRSHNNKPYLIKSKLMTKQIGNSGYFYVMLKNNKIGKHIQIHRAVAIAFIPNPENKPQVNHIDCNKLNNDVSNLEWVTPQENMRHAYSNNLIDVNKTAHYGADNHSSRKVCQIDLNTNTTINIFNTMTEAKKSTGCNVSNICECCKGNRKQSGGFKWSYYQD